MKFHVTWPNGLSEFLESECETVDAFAMQTWGKATAELVALEHRVLIALHVEKSEAELAAEAEAARIEAEVKTEMEARHAALIAKAEEFEAIAAAHIKEQAEAEAAALAQQDADALKPAEQAPASDDAPAAT